MANNDINRDRNPRNPGSDLFKTLTRLFSGPIVNYRGDVGKKLRRQQLDKYASRFKSMSGQSFKRMDDRGLINHLSLNQYLQSSQNRATRYIDFEQMEFYPELAAALDLYAEEMTTHSSLQPLLTINCANEEIKSILHTLYYDVLNVPSNLFGWCRGMCKYGDYFLYLDIEEQKGIINAISLPTQEVERLEGKDKTNPSYIQYQWNTAGMTFENWQMSHFRILGNDKYTPYGTSILEAARRIFRQLILLEDAMMAYRIVRSPERRVFYVDVGGIPPQDVEQHIQKVMTSTKRNSIVDESTGRVDLRYNAMSVEDDYWIPVRGSQSGTKIETLSGGQFTGDIDDVKYLRDKLFSAIKIPASYLSHGEGAEEDKTTLAQKDVRFARTIQRLQRPVISELEKLGIIHLYVLGYRNDDLLNFTLSLNNPSKLAELQELEHWSQKFDVASKATEGFFSRRWIAEHVFSLSEEEFVRNQRELYYDRKYDASLQRVIEGGDSEAALGGGGMGGDLGGELDLGGEDNIDLGAELGDEDFDIGELGGPEGPAGDEAAPADDSMLLAAPSGESEQPLQEVDVLKPGQSPKPGHEYTRPGWKGKVEKQTAKNKGSVARQKNYKSAMPEAGRTARTLVPGSKELSGLSKGNIYEEQNTNYNESIERDFANIEKSTQNLIKSLENAENVLKSKKLIKE